MELRNRSLPCWTTSIAELQAGIAKLQFEQGSTSQQKDWQAFHTFDEVSVSHLREVSVSHLRRVRTSISDGQLLVDSVAPGRRCVSDPFILLPAVLPSICDATSTAIYMCSVLCLYVYSVLCHLYVLCIMSICVVLDMLAIPTHVSSISYCTTGMLVAACREEAQRRLRLSKATPGKVCAKEVLRNISGTLGDDDIPGTLRVNCAYM